MLRKMIACLLLVTVVVGAKAARRDEVTLVMVPREDGVVRVGMDVANRFPSLFITYKVVGREVSLHGWDGKKWVNIDLENFKEGDFFRKGPDSALIVEKKGVPVPDALIPPEGWCPSVYKITTTELRPLLHLTGQYYDFKYKDWSWFSDKYKLSMEAINPEGLNISWYHKQLGDHFKKGPASGDDLKYWSVVRHPLPPVVEAPVETNVVEVVEQPIVEESVVEEPVEEPVEERPEMEVPEDPMVDPFSSEAAAAIVIDPAESTDEE